MVCIERIEKMNLDQYVKVKYKNHPQWFVEEIANVSNQQRIQNVISNKDYLEGKHKILQRSNFKYNGQVIEPRKIVLQYAKTLLNFQVAYLLKNNVQITGNEKLVDEFVKVSKLGKFSFNNQKILEKMLKFGQCAEYLYMDRNVIKSKVLDPAEYTPVYNQHNELLAVIEHWIHDSITYYVVYTSDTVQEWSNEGGQLKLLSQFANLSGLPIIYVADNEYGDMDGRSDLEDWISILDSLEDLISKYSDSMYKYMNPIPVAIGQQIKAELPSDIVGGGLNLDDGADFKMVSNQLDSKSFEVIYKTLLQSLLDISQTPAVSMNKTDISNLSEVSIKLLFSLADVKAGMNEDHLKRGLYERYEKVRELLKYRGITLTDDEMATLDFSFVYNIPSNHKEIIDNLKVLKEMNTISTESLLELSPYVSDKGQELERMQSEGIVNKVIEA